ncbi:MAG TPA: hypothetical protein VGI10_30270 [Polyangiaceae bacterium]|jgi:hypothetical protein
MNSKKRTKSITALGFAALIVPAIVTSSSCKAVKDAQSSLCCDAFKVGADMSGADFGVDVSIKGSFTAVAQAASDLSATATASLDDVTNACKNIATDLGADPNDASVKGKKGTDAVTAWCALAVAQINGSFGASGTLATSVSVSVTPPVCSASVSANVDCQANCKVDASCDVNAMPPTCEGGKLTVQCDGSCMASAGASISCTGSCSGNCSGSCSATAMGGVDCTGKCEGTCTAGGSSMGTGIQADGTCNGTCSGKCTYTDPMAKVSCSGSCEGSCDAACTGTAMAKVTCDGMCTGNATPLKCTGGTLKANCMMDADCQGSCNASASAKADCTPPSVSVTATAAANLTADGQLNLQAALNSLKLNLPKLLLVVQGRAKDFTVGITAAGSASANIAAAGPSKLNLSGAACIIPIVDAVADASTNFAKAVSAGGSVATSLKIGS